jgi:serine O-acetyltransferase
MPKNIYSRLVYMRTLPLVGRLAYVMLKALGAEIPLSVRIGKNFHLVHGGVGTVIHPHCEIGDNVKVYQGVTLGRGDIYRAAGRSRFKGIKVGNDVIICPGAKVLGSADVLEVRDGTIVKEMS